MEAMSPTRATRSIHPHLHKMKDAPSSTDFRLIGSGSDTNVWVPIHGSSDIVVKTEKPRDDGEGDPFRAFDGGAFTVYTRNVHDEYNWVRRLQIQFDRKEIAALMRHSNLYLPAVYRTFYETTFDWWQTRLSHFPVDNMKPARGIVMERIAPFDVKAREALLQHFCPPSQLEEARHDPANKDCLVIPHLGSRTRQAYFRVKPFKFQSLQDLKLNADQLEALNLDTISYARSMADALAVMLWSAKMDGNGVQFYLAPPKKESDPESPISQETTSNRTSISSMIDSINFDMAPSESSYIDVDAELESPFFSDVLGEHVLWIMGLDQCREVHITDEESISNAVSAFIRSAGMYPKPAPIKGEEYRGRVWSEADQEDDRNDDELWGEFRQRFLHVSSRILADGDAIARSAPVRYIHEIETRMASVNKTKLRRRAKTLDSVGSQNGLVMA